MPAPTIAALLDVARTLVAQRPFDVEAALTLLAALPRDDLDVQIRGAIRHAQLVVGTARENGSAGYVMARFALARVTVLLEEREGGVW